MKVIRIEGLSTRAKNSLIVNGFTTLKDISKADFYDIFALYAFKHTPNNVKILIDVMHKNGYPEWGVTPLIIDK